MPLSAPAAALAALMGLAPGLVLAQPHAAGPRVASAPARGRRGARLRDARRRLVAPLRRAHEARRLRDQDGQGNGHVCAQGRRASSDRNNTNALVTVHFNTPVTSARLVPHGHDLWFVVALARGRPAHGLDGRREGRRRRDAHRAAQGPVPARRVERALRIRPLRAPSDPPAKAAPPASSKPSP